MKKLFLLLTLLTTPCFSHTLDTSNLTPSDKIQQLMNVVEYIKEENSQLAEQLTITVDTLDKAFDDVSLSKILDSLLDFFTYSLKRIKYFEEHFDEKVFVVISEADNK